MLRKVCIWTIMQVVKGVFGNRGAICVWDTARVGLYTGRLLHWTLLYLVLTERKP